MDTKRKEIINHGDWIRLESWQECALHVMDIGSFSVLGALIDIKKNAIVMPLFVAPLEGEWIKIPTAKEVIDSL